MPAILSTPETISESVNTVAITSHTIDHENNTAVIVYDKGYIDAAANFIPVVKSQVLALDALDVQAVIVDANTILAGMATPEIYTALKQALYNFLLAQLGVTATVE